MKAFVNGREELSIAQTMAAPIAGAIGLWVDIRTEGYFSNLRITPQ